MKLRIGQGFDTHPFEQGRKLVLGGVEIEHSHGLKGHSDADALIHAMCDAMLGALALGDIGSFFSDTDPQNKDRNSIEFLQGVYEKVQDQGFKIVNIDSTIITEAPKIAPHISAMKKILTEVLHLQENQLSIKATRPEKMGALGRNEGLLALATVLLVSK